MSQHDPPQIVQVSWQGYDKRAGDGASAVPVHGPKAGQEQRGAQQRFRRAYVNAQLAQQWAAGQDWAELDACGVPWSPEASAAAKDRWLEVRVLTTVQVNQDFLNGLWESRSPPDVLPPHSALAAAGGCMPSQAGSQGKTCSSARAECSKSSEDGNVPLGMRC